MKKIISFSYLPQLHEDYKTGELIEIFRPYIPIRISYTRGPLTNYFDALVDSGADRNLLPLNFGEIVGINFKKVKPKIISGIGGVEIKAYPSSVNIWVNNIKYQTEADFSSEQKTPLLGRNGFFNLFKQITFTEKERFIHIVLF